MHFIHVDSTPNSVRQVLQKNLSLFGLSAFLLSRKPGNRRCPPFPSKNANSDTFLSPSQRKRGGVKAKKDHESHISIQSVLGNKHTEPITVQSDQMCTDRTMWSVRKPGFCERLKIKPRPILRPVFGVALRRSVKSQSIFDGPNFATFAFSAPRLAFPIPSLRTLPFRVHRKV